VYLGRGIDGVSDALGRADENKDRRRHAVQRLWNEDWAGAHDLVARLKEAYTPLLSVFRERGPQSMQAIASAHVAVAEAVCRLPEAETSSDDGSPLWQGEAGAAASSFFAGLIDPQLPALQISAPDYPDLYRSLLVGQNVRPRVAVHPRLSIWGPFEARLQQPDARHLKDPGNGQHHRRAYADGRPIVAQTLAAVVGVNAHRHQRLGHMEMRPFVEPRLGIVGQAIEEQKEHQDRCAADQRHDDDPEEEPPGHRDFLLIHFLKYARTSTEVQSTQSPVVFSVSPQETVL
jgi:hypothetical protein